MLEQLVRPKARVQLKRTPDLTKTEFDAFMQKLGHCTDQAKADVLGVSRTVVLKTRKEEQPVTSDFIAAVRATYPLLPYDHFFEETTEPFQRPSRAA